MSPTPVLNETAKLLVGQEVPVETLLVPEQVPQQTTRPIKNGLLFTFLKDLALATSMLWLLEYAGLLDKHKEEAAKIAERVTLILGSPVLIFLASTYAQVKKAEDKAVRAIDENQLLLQKAEEADRKKADVKMRGWFRLKREEGRKTK